MERRNGLVQYWWMVAGALVCVLLPAAAEAGGLLDFLGDLGGGIATGGLSTILGGITGVFGSWLNNRYQIKLKELDYHHAETMVRENRTTMVQEAKAAVQKLTVISEGKIDEEIAKGREASLRQANVGDEVLALVDGLRAGWFKGYCIFLLVHVYMLVKLIRPAIAIYLLTAGTLFVGRVFWLLEKQGDLDQILTDSGGQLILYTANCIFYFIGVVIAYYYQERNRLKAPGGFALGSGGAVPPGGPVVVSAPVPEPGAGGTGGAPIVPGGIPPGHPPAREDDEVLPDDQLP